MKNKKLLKLMAIITVSGVAATCALSFSGCGLINPVEHKHTWSETWSYDETNHWKDCTNENCDLTYGTAEHDFANGDTCSVCGAQKENQPPVESEHTWSETWSYDETNHWKECVNEDCDLTYGTAAHDFANGDTCSVCGAQKENQPPVESEHTWSETWSYNETNHWKECIDENCDLTDGTAAHDLDVNGACKVCDYAESGSEEGEYDDVTTAFDYESAIATYGYGNKLAQDTTFGKFTLQKGARFDDKNGENTINTQGKSVTIVLNGRTNSISFTAGGASSSNDTVLTLYLVKDGEETAITTGLTTDGSDGWAPAANGVNAAYKATGLTAGTYVIKTSASARLFKLSVTELLLRGETTGIRISTNNVKLNFLTGDDFTSAGLEVYLVYDNGREDLLTEADFEVNSDLFNSKQAGTYQITVKYSANESFVQTYDVTVSAVSSENALTLYTHTLTSQRVTQVMQKVFKVGDTLTWDNLTVYINSTQNDSYKLASSAYTVTLKDGFDMNTAGEKTVVVTATEYGVSAEYTINVLDLSGVNKESVLVKVDANADVNVNGNVVTVNNLTDALRVYKLLELEDSVIKEIDVAEGTYFEKVEVDIPNVYLKGLGSDASKVVIEYNLTAACTDPSGTSAYSTDGSATISVRESAKGFHAENITFQNYWNTHARYIESQKLGSDTQAVAMLVQADMCYFENVRFSSYHDTLYSQYGRHVYKNCYIEGRTDYVFGFTATSYFENCTLHTLYGESDKNGGYLIATKGSNNSGGEVVEYGYVFYNCTFEADEQTVDGTVSFARGWGDAMTLAFIECNVSAAYSTEGYGNTVSNKNDRYVKMNAAPNATRLFEYGNKGAGALTYDEGFTGVLNDSEGYPIATIISYEKSREFLDFTKIFAEINGEMVYSKAWDGSYGIVISEKTYDLATLESASGTTATEDAPAMFFNDEVSLVGSYRIQGGTGFQLSVGAVFTFKLKGKITVNWYGGSYGTAADGLITYKDGYATLTITGAASGNNTYIKSITIDPTEVPEDSSFHNVEIYVIGETENSLIGTIENVVGGYTVSESQVNAIFDASSFNGYQIDGVYTNADATEAFSYSSAITANTYLYLKISEILDYTIRQSTTIDLTECTDAYEGTTGSYKGIEIDATNGKFANNGSGWIQVNAGTVIKVPVVENVVVYVTEYQDAGKVAISEYVDGYITVTATENTYISKVTVIVIEQFTQTATVNMSGIPETIQNGRGSYGGIEIDATASGAKAAPNGDWMLINAGTVLTIYTVEGATVSFVEYQDAGLLQISENVNGVITLTAEAQTYVKTITVSVPLKTITSTYVHDYADQGMESTEYCELNISDNGNMYKVKSGETITFYVEAGATVTISGIYYSEGSWLSFIVNDGGVDSEVLVVENGVCTYTVVNGGKIVIKGEGSQSAFKVLTVTVPDNTDYTIRETTTIDLTECTDAYQGTTGSYNGIIIDATNGKFANNNSGWIQVNAGTVIKVPVVENATLTLVCYSNIENFTISEYAEGYITITVTANDYIKTITVTVPDDNDQGGEEPPVQKATTYTFSYSAISATTDKTELTQAYFTGDNAFITVIDSSKVIYRTSPKCIENKGANLSVTFTQAGTITITFSSTGNGNESHFGLKDSNGNYLVATSFAEGITLLTEGADAGAYTMTGTTQLAITFAIEKAGTYYIDCPSGETNRGARIFSIVMVDGEEEEAPSTGATTTYTFSYSAISATTDKTELTQAYFTGDNAFITVIDSKKVTYRTSPKCIENKGANLSVTFTQAGTITITFSSTGNGNESHFGLKDSNGNYLVATSYSDGITLLTEGADAGAYTMTGTTQVTITFAIEKAGTYYIDCPSGETNRGARIYAIVMVEEAVEAKDETDE